MPRRVVIVEPVSSGQALVSRAHALGWGVLVASYDQGDRRLPDGLRSRVSEILRVDANDECALEQVLREAHREAPLDGVIAGLEFAVPAVARLTSALGLPGLAPVSADKARHKGRMRSAVAAAGLGGPRFATVTTPEQLNSACEYVGFPAVMKPVDSSGSIHVRRVDDMTAARAALRAIHTESDLDLGRELGHEAIIEQYVSGTEYSADGYVTANEPIVVAVTRKLLSPEPYFIEMGHLTPAPLDDPSRRAIVGYAQDIVRAVGITSGVFHCEVRLCEGVPVLMEIAARLPGDRICELVQLATGVDLALVALAAATGEDAVCLGAFGTARTAVAGIRFWTADGMDCYEHLDGWDSLATRGWVIGAEVLIGSDVPIPLGQDFRCRVAAVSFIADSSDQALSRWHEIGDAIRVRGLP